MRNQIRQGLEVVPESFVPVFRPYGAQPCALCAMLRKRAGEVGGSTVTGLVCVESHPHRLAPEVSRQPAWPRSSAQSHRWNAEPREAECVYRRLRDAYFRRGQGPTRRKNRLGLRPSRPHSRLSTVNVSAVHRQNRPILGYQGKQYGWSAEVLAVEADSRGLSNHRRDPARFEVLLPRTPPDIARPMPMPLPGAIVVSLRNVACRTFHDSRG